MKITIKEIGISSAFIVGSGIIIACISACAKKKTPFKTAENKQKLATAIKKQIVSGQEQMIPEQEVTPEQQKQPIKEVIKIDAPNDSVLKLIPDDFPLRLGSKGTRVRDLQTYLLKHHGWGGIVTDEYDKTMDARVRK